MGIHAILLAAGGSKRMGAPKQLIDIKGRSLIRHMAKMALHSNIDGLTVVLGAFRENLLPELINLPLNTVINPDWKKGMGASLKTAMHVVFPEQEGIMIMVCDQPYLTADILNQLIKEFQENPEKIVTSAYANTVGTPAIFGNAYFEAIKEISDDQGARSLFDQFSDQVISIPFPKGDFDLDTPEDLANWQKDK